MYIYIYIKINYIALAIVPSCAECKGDLLCCKLVSG